MKGVTYKECYSRGSLISLFHFSNNNGNIKNGLTALAITKLKRHTLAI